MLKPTRDEFDAAARRGRIVPLRQRVPADLETPVSAFLKLTRMPGGERARFLLESVERGIQVGRYSFIGVSPSATLRLDGDTVTIDRDGALDRFPLGGRDPLSFVRDEIARVPVL
ncbi:MAG: anthranilate synthase component I, partial [Candidatus Krumholzibacteria bacterium]|nr:anthranilate synthase component I [Candidatus Krumholzibacteria bacterium]